MINTNRKVKYDARALSEDIVYIKMGYPIFIQDSTDYLIPIFDYILDNGVEIIIHKKQVKINADIFDTLQNNIIQGYGITGNSIEKQTKARPYALLEFVKNDYIRDTDKLIYGTLPEDWVITQ